MCQNQNLVLVLTVLVLIDIEVLRGTGIDGFGVDSIGSIGGIDIGVAHRLYLTVCNSLGLWLRKPKRFSSSSPVTTSIPQPDSDCSDEEDLADDDRLCRASLANQYSARHDDGSEQSVEGDDNEMSVSHQACE
ncbi:unnamed protein product [Didymodactylos carnosus]|uniref:Uncharacterized protein n=1 Tax=Didymodactylos carnosus TaxID=1234261 RepID=A0A8S2GDQ2_9BILA|nr:unnamed protein product [Didymodactylos carnosus]CAF3498998.1 unnamed protein product [Didymodactylos carnosus]